jgi:membrane associated rhomboid family serine protease
MMPIGDDNSDRRITPIVNWILIGLNILVFVFFQGMGANERFTYAYSTVPREIVTGPDVDHPVTVQVGNETAQIDLQPTPIPVWFTLLTSMFMHGGLMHLFGNMLYLWIFGDNLEDRLGHMRYGLFYVLCGIVAGLSHVLVNTDSYLPSLGASGAISGVLGGYMLLFPKKRVRVMLGRAITDVPAYVALGFWIVFQIFSSAVSGAEAGVAYAAHIGGFIAGLVLIKPFAFGRTTQVA